MNIYLPSLYCLGAENNNWKLGPAYSTTGRSLCSQYLNWVVISVISVLHANAACPQITNPPPRHSSTYRTSCREKQQHNAQQQPFSWISEQQRPQPRAATAKMLRKCSTKTRRWHHGCSGARLSRLRWFSVDFSPVKRAFQVCWQNSWLCCVHGNTLLFVSFHCWHLWQVDYIKSASRFLSFSKALTVNSYFIISQCWICMKKQNSTNLNADFKVIVCWLRTGRWDIP